MEVKSPSKITVSFYGMNYQSVEYPKQIPDFLQVHGSTENKEAPMPDLPSFDHKPTDLDDMLARFDADVMQIEKNFDSLKGSLATLSQGLSKEKNVAKDGGPKFQSDLDQIFADFDQEVHKALVIPDSPKEEFTEPLSPKEDSWLHPANISPAPAELDLTETEEFNLIETENLDLTEAKELNLAETVEFDDFDLPPLTEEDLAPLGEPAQEELDTIAREEAEADISEFLMEEVTPIAEAEDVEQLTSQTHTETFIIGKDIIEDIENVEVFLPKEEVMIGSVPVIEEESTLATIEGEPTVDVSYEEISIDSISPQVIPDITPIDIEPKEFLEENIVDEQSDSYFDILGKTTKELDELDISTPINIEDSYEEASTDIEEHIQPIDIQAGDEDSSLSVDELLVTTTTPTEPVEELTDNEEVSLSTDELLAIPTMPTEPIEELADTEDVSLSADELSAIPTMPVEPVSEDEEVSLSTDELLAIPTMPTEPAQPAEMSIDLNAEAEILARFAALNSSSGGEPGQNPLVSVESRVPTSSTGITTLSRDELVTVLSEIDILLEYLPNHKIEELAHKDFYFLYLRLLDDLGI